MTAIGADLVVEVALKHERAERARVVRELCRGDAELERLAHALLEHYERPGAALPAGPFPTELGPFTLERELGAGAHGKVYLARRRPLDGYVALKLLRPGPGMSEFVEQVRREAGRARRIPSVHVVPVFDAGRIDGGPYYVEMAVCADPDEASPGSIRIGRSLGEARAGLSADDAARIVEDLARAVHAAHRTGIVHGDLKPENVLLTPETRRVMLADFGIATSLAASAAPGPAPVGTIAYMAPEQWRDRLPPSEASDVYGLGGTLYFLLCGAAPHAARAEGEDPPTPALPADVPPRLREIVMRALASDPADRPPSAGALADELRRFRSHEPTWHDRRSPPRRLLQFARRHLPEVVAAAAVLALLLPLGVGGYRALTGQVRKLAEREAALRGRLDELDRARHHLERETARLEGEADAKQRELARVEARLQQLPKLDQALGAAREQAEAAQAAAAQRELAERRAAARVAVLEAELETAREALARASEREAAALGEAGRAAGERDAARARLARMDEQLATALRDAIAQGEVARRQAEERRAALERELRDKEAALAAARAAHRAPGEPPHEQRRAEREQRGTAPPPAGATPAGGAAPRPASTDGATRPVGAEGSSER